MVINEELFNELFPIDYQINIYKNIPFTPPYGEWKKIINGFFTDCYKRIK